MMIQIGTRYVSDNYKAPMHYIQCRAFAYQMHFVVRGKTCGVNKENQHI